MSQPGCSQATYSIGLKPISNASRKEQKYSLGEKKDLGTGKVDETRGAYILNDVLAC